MVVLQTEMLLIPLVLVLTGVSHGAKTVCDVRQLVTCHGTLGEPTYLQLQPNAIGHQLLCKKITQNGYTGGFRFRNNQTVFFNESLTSSIQERWHFVPTNGTIIINPATKRDSGTYRLEIYNEETGKFVANTTMQLIVLGTHSTVRSILTDRTDNPSKMETRVCTHSTVRSILTDRTHNPSKMETHVYMVSLIAASLGVVLLCVTVYGGVYYICQRRTHTPKPAESVEVVYAEINVLKRENKQPEQRMREEEGSVYSTHMSFSVAKADAEAD